MATRVEPDNTTIARILELKSQRYTIDGIAVKLSLPRQTVRSVASGWPLRRRRQRPVPVPSEHHAGHWRNRPRWADGRDRPERTTRAGGVVTASGAPGKAATPSAQIGGTSGREDV